MQRRAFLKALGLAGAALGCPRAFAQSAAPRRLVVVSHCHGWPHASWRLDPRTDDLAQADWTAPLAPLATHQRRVLVLDGLSLLTAELDVDGNRHDAGWVHAWTGDRADFSAADTRATSPSLDQLVAAHIGRPDRLPSLELSLDDAAENGRPVSYGADGGRLPVAASPEAAWRRLFGASGADPLGARRQAAIDFAHAEYAALKPRLGPTQKDRLESHFELLVGLRRRLDGMARLGCDVPAEPGPHPTYDARFDAYAELIAAAFACDITRVVSLSLGEMPTADFGWDHVTDDVHKGLAHGIYDDPQKHQAMTDYVGRHAAQVARLVALLEATPDVDGRSLMDNTLVVWGSELADGWHGFQHYCPVLIGGEWHFRTGRALHWPHETPAELLTPTGYSAVAGLPHQHLLVSVAQAMGLAVDHVGIEHIQSRSGHRIDCRGPLKGLT